MSNFQSTVALPEEALERSSTRSFNNYSVSHNFVAGCNRRVSISNTRIETRLLRFRGAANVNSDWLGSESSGCLVWREAQLHECFSKRLSRSIAGRFIHKKERIRGPDCMNASIPRFSSWTLCSFGGTMFLLRTKIIGSTLFGPWVHPKKIFTKTRIFYGEVLLQKAVELNSLSNTSQGNRLNVLFISSRTMIFRPAIESLRIV